MSDNTMGRFFAYLNWLFNPFHGLKTTEVYDLIGTTSLTENALYLNLGYYRDTSITLFHVVIASLVGARNPHVHSGFCAPSASYS